VLIPADVTRLLRAEEIVWLADGRRVELAVLSPRELVAAVELALAEAPAPPEVPGAEGIRLSRVSPLAAG
jgi:hypothetical protein